MLDVLLDPFLFGKGLVANCIVSVDVCGLINPQPSKLGYRRETGHGRTVLLFVFVGFSDNRGLAVFVLLVVIFRLLHLAPPPSASPTISA
jgi:hypothetical protein